MRRENDLEACPHGFAEGEEGDMTGDEAWDLIVCNSRCNTMTYEAIFSHERVVRDGEQGDSDGFVDHIRSNGIPSYFIAHMYT